MKIFEVITSEHVKGGLDSYYQLTKAKRLAKADGHDYDKLPEYHRGKDQPHKEKYMALAKDDVTENREGDNQTQYQKIQRLQKMSRGGIDISHGAEVLGRGEFSQSDPEDLYRARADDITKDVNTQRDSKKDLQTRKEKEKERADKIKKKNKEYRQRKIDDKQGRISKQVQQQADTEKNVRVGTDNDRGLRKSSDGKTLRDPRYYTKKGDKRAKPLGAISTALARIRHGADPVDDVADYYNQKIDQIKAPFQSRY
tara:strand:- start:352 stop:1116 length:765 start_codon:yes stop_codon:yes gene_type:complete